MGSATEIIAINTDPIAEGLLFFFQLYIAKLKVYMEGNSINRINIYFIYSVPSFEIIGALIICVPVRLILNFTSTFT